MTEKQPEALKLAEILDSHVRCAQVSEENDFMLRSKFVELAAAELRRLHSLNQEWEIKAATWLASPEAAQKLEGYRELAQRVNTLETQNQELLAANKDSLGHFDALMADHKKLQGVQQELVEALKEIADWIDRYTTPGHPVSRVARAAIAKAEGVV